ncbi:hypothetical protein DL771_010433 [Monosporascus sp. 5C6A]|nr:hypothetical protein DL771_010433 [Monosporascus sp. 5C6A]
MAFPIPTTTLQHAIRQASSTVTNAPVTSPVYFLTSQYVTIPGVTNEHVTVPDKTVTMVLPTCIQTIEPDANGHLPPGTCHAIWNYYPSFSGSLIFLFLFGLLTIAHVYQAVIYKKRFCWAIVMASLWETVAYLFRTVSTRHQNIAGVYTVYRVFILVSPLWVNAFVRIVYRFAEFSSISNTADNPVSVNESYFYALEAAPMVLAILAFNLVHPGRVFVGQDADMPGFFGACVALVRRRMGQKELTQSSEKDEVFVKDVRESYAYKSGA